MIDLKPFCSRDQKRPYFQAPFSRGEYTWATNGHILLRVPRQTDVPEVPGVPEVERALAACQFGTPMEIMRCELPTESFRSCPDCDGSGHLHDCPKCTCSCTACDGSGNISNDDEVSVGIGPGVYDCQYVRALLHLPERRVYPAVTLEDPMGFSFEGGIGALMPLRSQRKFHVQARLAE